MKVLVFSDSHGHTTRMLEIIERESPDAVIHLGDYVKDTHDINMAYQTMPLYVVRGNNDWISREPMSAKVVLAGVSIFMSHGHVQYVRQGTDGMLQAALDSGCKVALFGHTHQALKEYRRDILFMNPGSITLPRCGKPSFIRLTLQNGVAEGEIIDVD